ncbi:MAG TPA: YIP1 family protein [Anaerolineae bacterium]|nr:YIP1 family protein [Anaerolineae bacterium]
MLLNRILGVLKLDANTFEEIEADQSALIQAGLVVVVSNILFGLGTGAASDNGLISVVISNIIGGLLLWAFWAIITNFVGTRFFGGKADLGEMLRVLGFANAPYAFGILSFIPFIGVFISIAVAIWSIAAAFVAVRQGLDIDNGKTAIVILIGAIPIIIIRGLLLVFAFTAILVSLITNAG